MERFLRVVSSLLDAIGTLVTAIVILGGGVVGAALAGLFLAAENFGPVLYWGGVLAGGLAGAFLTWLAMRLFFLLGVD